MLVKLREILEARKQTSNLERRCVADVASKDKNGDPRSRVGRAFAICRASLQKSGRFKPGTADLTKLGARRSSASGRKKDNENKINKFEKLIKSARKK